MAKKYWRFANRSSVSRQHQRPRRSRTGLTKEKTKTFLGSTSSWAKAYFPPAPEPVHSRARLAKCQNNSPPLHSWRGGRGVRSSSAKAARQGFLLATLFPVCASGPGAPAPGSPRQKPRRLYIFLAQGPFPVCARTRALPRTARQMPKQFSPSPFMERGRGVRSSSAGKAVRLSSGSRCGHFSSQRQKILRAQRPFVVINSPQIPGPTHQRTHIFTRKFFQMVCQLLSEHRCLGVNNPGVVDWDSRQSPMV